MADEREPRALRVLQRLRPDRSRRLGGLIPRSQGTLVPRNEVPRSPSREVQRIGAEAPSEYDVESVWHEVRRVYQTGLHPAIALNITHRGRVILDRTLGHVWNPPGGPTGPVATPDTLFNLFSASKIVTAALVQTFVDEGLLDLDAPAVRYVPEFGRHGKGRIRVHHLLNHTAGIPDMPAGFDLEASLDAGVPPLEGIWELRPQSRPGRRIAYSPIAAWFVVQAILERLGGKDLRTLLRDRILDPLGFETLDYGVPPERVDEVARHAVTGPAVPSVMSEIFARGVGVPFARAVEITNDPRFLTGILPSANVIGTPREVGRFLTMLLHGGELDGVRVLSEAGVRRMTRRVTRRQFDGTFGMPMKYGLGVMMGGTAFSLFGLDTAGAFGHLGLSTVVVYADPSRDLAVTFLNTGKPMADLGMVRWYWTLQRIVASVPRS